MIRFTVHGPARGKGRPRFGNGRAFTDQATASYENLVKITAQDAMSGRGLLQGPLHLEISVLKLVPASWPRKKREAADWCTTKPDFDNLQKIFADAMNGTVYRDDAQIARAMFVKRYGEFEGVMVTIWELEP